MAAYQISWITENLALGHAPMSYDELDSMRSQGISAIVNLCGEFCDLHEIQQGHGFEVYYLPTCDDEAPTMEDLEKALDWLDEAIYLGKKVLVHCRLGIGRTGTFVTAYLLRKGFALKLAKKKVENIRATSSSFSQWRLLKKYHQSSGRLTIREPSLENKRIVDLSPFFQDYEACVNQVDSAFRQAAAADADLRSCGLESEECCYSLMGLHAIEAAYLSHHVNKMLTRDQRKGAIQRALAVSKRIGELNKTVGIEFPLAAEELDRLQQFYARGNILCPLNVDSRCQVYAARPIACRLYGVPVSLKGEVKICGKNGERVEPELDYDELDAVLERISKNMLHALTSFLPDERRIFFTLSDTVSGRFVQQYFDYLVSSR
jgi:protein-tyrosine phosphatase